MKCMAMVAGVAAAVLLNGGLAMSEAGAATESKPAAAIPRTGGCFCGAVRSFCARCGTPICFRGDHGTSKTVDITVGSLDDAKDFAPTEDVFPEQRMPWVKPVK